MTTTTNTFNNSEIIDLVIVDDHKMILNGLISFLKTQKNINITKVLYDGQSVLEHLAVVKTKPQIILLDINLPDINGMEVCKIINRLYNDIKVIAFTNYNEASFIEKMMKSGASGYVIKHNAYKDIIPAITTVADNTIYLPECYISKKNTFTTPNNTNISLTRGERKVLNALLNANKFDTEDLSDIDNTITNNYLTNLLNKFGTSNTEELIELTKHLKF